ncbi:beta-propeller domain-containing protein [Heliophilum fasciatum]|uniref:Putative secreted protein with C-terminal beta-propeller domain n=1 Tax=Heliophilum fasciatum TaxID=35700 RepID=A0A4R2RNX0_9FIRM|nr:beta-propeller domain-containing protein [Heliophilum fasciatum]MCW2277981.1 putative secreted protein with C-terminal beta-propeller domain [Heliophilum fasciatum]TCP64399.1 putative secreted protein with C-terminal beta-propeller domain [Heliophilum fasciatum]
MKRTDQPSSSVPRWLAKPGRYSLAVSLLLAGIAIIGAMALAVTGVPAMMTIAPALAATTNTSLPVVGNYTALRAILERAQAEQEAVMEDAGLIRGSMPKMAIAQKADMPVMAPAAEVAPSSAYSTTNIQVAGVDEADIVKTDGQYIYQVNRQRLLILKAAPSDAMVVTAQLTYDERAMRPQEIYINGNCLVVIGQQENLEPDYDPVPYEDRASEKLHPIMPAWQRTVKTIVYDIGDRSRPQVVREFSLTGDYVSSRRVGDDLYLVANRYLGFGLPEKEDPALYPQYRDTATADAVQTILPGDIRYFPDFRTPNYLIVAGLKLNALQEKAQVQAYLGSGENIYASPQHLYVAVTGYTKPVYDLAPRIAMPPFWGGLTYPEKTRLYRFNLAQGAANFGGQTGEVPGRILNQYSMDEQGDHLRIATTQGNHWGRGEPSSSNNLYVLDRDLKVQGKIEGIAPGEQIYSVRFMGHRAYMVTFKKVDPLFVIDLQEPTQPKILGALKIPGYSDYLHPYDENHIIGFGKDTIEMAVENDPFRAEQTRAFYQGLKIALFDVTDVTHPVEKFVEKIGDRGTDSELLRNPKALLFDRERRLLALPVALYQLPATKQEEPSPWPAYGEFAYQGLYVYQLDRDAGFRLRGRITHLDDQEMLKMGNPSMGMNGDSYVQRALYIGDTLYTLSLSQMQAHDLNRLEKRGSLSLSN